MAYEILTGYQVSARSPQAMLTAHAVEKPEPIDRRRPSVPPALQLQLQLPTTGRGLWAGRL